MLTKSVCYIVPVWLPASVFILVISKKAVPLQRISKVEMLCVEELDNC